MKNNNMLCKHPPAVNFLRRYALVILLGLLVLLFSLKTTSFFTGRNLSNVLIVQVTHRMYVHWCAFGLDRK